MKIALRELAHTVLMGWTQRKDNASPARFPTIVAQTTEGKIMDGPCGLRLITKRGPTLVDQTPEGFLVYQPVPHILQPTRLFSKPNPPLPS